MFPEAEEAGRQGVGTKPFGLGQILYSVAEPVAPQKEAAIGDGQRIQKGIHSPAKRPGVQNFL